eukprot:1577436-Rhodomonas_salina.1
MRPLGNFFEKPLQIVKRAFARKGALALQSAHHRRGAVEADCLMRLGSLLLAACLIACCVHVRAFSVSSAWFRDRSAGLMEVETTSRGRLPTNRRPSYPRAMARSEQRKSAQIWSRREVIASPLILGPVLLPTSSRGETSPQLVKVSDPATYSALTYAPRGVQGKLPLIVVLHGAGKNEKDVWNLADPQVVSPTPLARRGVLCAARD